MTWRIRHAGPGWIASNDDGTGAYFPAWDDAIRFVDRQAARDRHHAWADFDTDFRRAILKLASRDVPAAGYPGRDPISDVEVRAAQAMRENRRSWADIAAILGRPVPAIKSAVWRAEHLDSPEPSPDDVKPGP